MIDNGSTCLLTLKLRRGVSRIGFGFCKLLDGLLSEFIPNLKRVGEACLGGVSIVGVRFEIGICERLFEFMSKNRNPGDFFGEYDRGINFRH